LTCIRYVLRLICLLFVHVYYYVTLYDKTMV
jgi:hypothetical protein